MTFDFHLPILSLARLSAFLPFIQPHNPTKSKPKHNTTKMTFLHRHRDSMTDAHFDATADALNGLTDEASVHNENPKNTLHRPADQPKSHSLLKKIFPYDNLEQMEAAFHLGNYVKDRTTGQKSWEPMSIYVRVGMHALYYGSEQEKALHWKKTLTLLETQSKKMGKQYDDPASVEHIQPFIESFELQNTLDEMVQPDPTKYKTFNDFFAREIREDARPIAEPDNVSLPPSCLSAYLCGAAILT